MALRASQVAGLSSLVAIAVTAACEAPARVKPWRHAPDPTTEAANVPGSPALALDADGEAQVRAARSHTLRIHVDAEPGRLNPVVAPSAWARRIVVGTVFEPLIRYVPPDGSAPAGRFAPRLARSWRVLGGGTEIRIELEPGVKFHDGRPLTSSDVQFTLDAMRDGRRGIDHLRALLVDVEAVELITSHELRVRLFRPNGMVLRALAEIPILPMHIYEGSLLAGGALIGTGPWKLASHKGGTTHLTRFAGYWGTPAAIADLEFVHQPDAAIALRDAKRGDFDLVPALIPAHWPEQANAPGIAAAFRPLELRPTRMRYLAFNATHPALADARVRHALALLVHRREIEKRVFDGLARPVLWPIWPGGFASGAEAPVPDFDPAAAGVLLDAAGWSDTNRDGVRERGGEQLRLTMVGIERPAPRDASAPPLRSERDYFVDAARRIGVVIDVKTGGESWVEKRVAEGGYDLVELVWSGMADGELASRLGATAQRAGSPRIARTLEAMAAAWDPAERARLAGELATGLAETWPIAGIVADAPRGLIHRRVTGARPWDGWLDLTALRFEGAP